MITTNAYANFPDVLQFNTKRIAKLNMASTYSTFKKSTTSSTDIIDITDQVEDIVKKSSFLNGSVNIFVAGSTAALTTIEYESGVVNDLTKAIERLVPRDMAYEHDSRWGDGNGYAHVRADLLGPSLTTPLIDGKVLLGTWQQITLCDFDNRPRTREVFVQINSSD